MIAGGQQGEDKVNNVGWEASMRQNTSEASCGPLSGQIFQTNVGPIHSQESVGQNGVGRSCNKEQTAAGKTSRRTKRNSSSCEKFVTCASVVRRPVGIHKE